MSDVMLFGVLRMPYEMAMADEMSRYQFYHRAQEAADRLEAAERDLPQLPASTEPANQEAPQPSSTFSYSRNPLEHMPVMGLRYAYYTRDPLGDYHYADPQPTLLKPEYRMDSAIMRNFEISKFSAPAEPMPSTAERRLLADKIRHPMVAADFIAPSTAEQPRQNLEPMQDDEDQAAGIVREWYFNCDGHYIDVARDDDGKYSVYFRNRNDGEKGKLSREVWFDQADEVMPSTASEDERELFEKWAGESGLLTDLTKFHGVYQKPRAGQYWEVWKGRAALAKPSTIASAEGGWDGDDFATFAAWAKSKNLNTYWHSVGKFFTNMDTQIRWEVWQAAIAAATPGDAAKGDE